MTIKVIALNLWEGGNLLPDILQFLKREDAEVVALQEAYDGTDPVLPGKYRSVQALKTLGYEYMHFAEDYVETTDFGKIPHGVVTLSKFPVVDPSVIFMVDPPRGQIEWQDIPEHWAIHPAILQYVKLDIGSKELNFFNMHGVWDLDGDNYSVRRRKMGQVLESATKDIPNVILTGDSNASQGNPMWQEIGKHLKNAFDPIPTSTFNMRRKNNPGYATAAVDVMYTSPDIEVLEADCPDVDISDHLPLVVTLDIT